MITVFTDGSSRGNPGPGGWGGIVLDTHLEKAVELGGREDFTTNNRMELSACIETVGYVKKNNVHGSGIQVYSDSKYVIQGITGWVFGWQKNGWKTSAKKDVENRDLWEKLIAVTSGESITWTYVEGHAGHGGNERCDEIATSFADKNPVTLYNGSLSDYRINTNQISTGSVSKKGSKTRAYSYLSLVDKVPMRHSTWTECEKRVKGVREARWKKTASMSEEKEILQSWGVNLPS